MKARPIQSPIAWTGGKAPIPYRDMTEKLRYEVRCDFRAQIDGACGCGRKWFFTTPFGVLDYARILWNRSRHDVWASNDMN